MPFPFKLPTTSSVSLSLYFESDSHPSLPLSATTYRGVLRDTLKKHKRLPSQSHAANLPSVLLSIEDYLPYLFALDAGLSSQSVANEEVDIVLKCSPIIEWRATLSASPVPGHEPARQKLDSLEYELFFVLSTLAFAQTLSARAALQPLYSNATSSPSQEQRVAAAAAATQRLLSTASIEAYLSCRSKALSCPAPCIDITASTFQGLSCLALAEATLVAVLKDDPYPAAVAQDRNKNDKDWMIKAPELPKVRAHLFARLCLATSEHAARASALLSSSNGNTTFRNYAKIDDDLLKYVEDLRHTGRGKACRFFGIDADLSGETGTALAWLQAGLHELGLLSPTSTTSGSSTDTSTANSGASGGVRAGLSRLKHSWAEKREERKVDSGRAWGADAGKAEEGRVLESLQTKWAKMNDTINTQLVPPFRPLLATMPSGREMYVVKPYRPPQLDESTLTALRAPLEEKRGLVAEGGSTGAGADGGVGEAGNSSDDEAYGGETGGGGGEGRSAGRSRSVAGGATVVGAFPGTGIDYGSASTASNTTTGGGGGADTSKTGNSGSGGYYYY